MCMIYIPVGDISITIFLSEVFLYHIISCPIYSRPSANLICINLIGQKTAETEMQVLLLRVNA